MNLAQLKEAFYKALTDCQVSYDELAEARAAYMLACAQAAYASVGATP